MKRLFVWAEEPTTFDFSQLKLEGWEVEEGKPPYDIWIFSVFVGNHITGEPELWKDLSQNFRGLLIYNLDTDMDLTEDVIRNMLRADLITVPSDAMKDKVVEATEREPGAVRVVPLDPIERLHFWNTIQKASPW